MTPHSREWEKSVLSTILQWPEDRIPDAQEEGLTGEWFYIPAHRIIWRTVLRMSREEEPVELVSLTQNMRDDDTLSNCGGPAALTEIYGYSPTSAHFEHHLAGLKDKWLRRQALDYCAQLREACYDQSADLIPMLAEPVDAILDSAGSTQDVVDGVAAVGQWATNWKAKLDGEARDGRISCGITELDTARPGGALDRPGIVYLGAEPSMGKTALMNQIVVHRLEQEGEGNILVFSMEMTREKLLDRLLLHLCAREIENFDGEIVTNPTRGATKGELMAIKRGLTILEDERLMIDDTAGMTIAQIEAKVKTIHRRRPLSLIALDHLQLVESKQDGVEQRMTEVTRGVQRIKKATRATVLGLSQLNSDGNLKYARSLHEDVDIELRIFGDVEAKHVEGIFCRKDRNGPMAGSRFSKIRFDKESQTFYSQS